jgi:colanic acid/amylovoran biosynthesis protein
MKKVLLIGISGTYNYGCEAQVRGTVNILRKHDPETEVFYASYNHSDDVRRLAGCDVHIINRDRKGMKWLILRIIRKILATLGFGFVIPYDSFSWILKNNIDTVFSIGGDIYTLPPGKFYKNALALFCEKCLRNGLKYVLWGASVGPFDKVPEALAYYKEHLRKIHLIVARENNTVKYLKRLDIVDNVVFAPDPAFFVADGTVKSRLKEIFPEAVGINLSPLSAFYEYQSIERGIEIQAKAIADLLAKTSYSIYLIPHVFSPGIDDNDLHYLRKIYDLIPIEYKDRITLIEEDCGFVGLKKYFSQLSFVIAARMHCALNAISSGVPVIFLSYSEKAKGMADLIYNSNQSVITLKDFSDSNLVVNRLRNFNKDARYRDIIGYDFHPVLKQLS